MVRFKGIFIVLLLSFQCAFVFAAPHYNFLCGSDEDGCVPNKPGDMQTNYTCNCIADSSPADVCLDFNKGKCVPVDETTGQCALGAKLYPSRTACLTVLWQSDYSKTDPSKNCVPLSVKPVAHVCSVKCTSLDNCQKTPTK